MERVGRTGKIEGWKDGRTGLRGEVKGWGLSKRNKPGLARPWVKSAYRCAV